MATVLTDNSNYSAIAGAIRNKLGVQTQYKPGEMAAAIASIEGGELNTFTSSAGLQSDVNLPSAGKPNMPYSFTHDATSRFIFVTFSIAGAQTGQTAPYQGSSYVILNSIAQIVASGGFPSLDVTENNGTITVKPTFTANIAAGAYKGRFLRCDCK